MADIIETLDCLLKGSGLRGIVSVELKRDCGTGLGKVLEVSAREGKASLPACFASWLIGEHRVFSLSDPNPFVHRCIEQAKISLIRLMGR